MEKTYKTSQVAKIFDIHPNTVRFYEENQLISKPERLSNGYRVFSELHILQIKFIRTGLQVEVLQNGLRKKVIAIIKLSAQKDFSQAITETKDYMTQLQIEKVNALDSLEIAKHLMTKPMKDFNDIVFSRKNVSSHLHITIDTLRNWELNGLLTCNRQNNGYRIYTYDEIQRMKIIRSLRCANYSISSILRMMNAISKRNDIDIRQIIDTPSEDEEIVSACDHLLTSLHHASQNADLMMEQLELMKDFVSEQEGDKIYD